MISVPNKLKTAVSDILQLNIQYQNLQKQIGAMNDEMSNLGIFSKKRKLELQGQIADATSQSEKVKAQIASLVQSTSGYTPYAKALITIAAYGAGSKVHFGIYDFNGTQQPIEWQVLNVWNNMALLFATQNLCSLPYHNINMVKCSREDSSICHSCKNSTTWENSTLRTWLNGSFYQFSFTDDERSMIVTINNTNPNGMGFRPQFLKDDRIDDNPRLWGGNNTNDMIFVLSESEVNQYNVSSHGYWRRTPEGFGCAAAGGGYVYHASGVRPALWFNLSIQ